MEWIDLRKVNTVEEVRKIVNRPPFGVLAYNDTEDMLFGSVDYIDGAWRAEDEYCLLHDVTHIMKPIYPDQQE